MRHPPRLDLLADLPTDAPAGLSELDESTLHAYGLTQQAGAIRAYGASLRSDWSSFALRPSLSTMSRIAASSSAARAHGLNETAMALGTALLRLQDRLPTSLLRDASSVRSVSISAWRGSECFTQASQLSRQGNKLHSRRTPVELASEIYPSGVSPISRVGDILLTSTRKVEYLWKVEYLRRERGAMRLR